jgi:hypothetical protein
LTGNANNAAGNATNVAGTQVRLHLLFMKKN